MTNPSGALATVRGGEGVKTRCCRTAYWTVSVPFIPAASWPSTGQKYV